MAEPVAFRYRAFVSYSHADTAWAKWLHRGLKGFRIDKNLLVWVTNHFGSGPQGLAKLIELALIQKAGGNLDEKLTYTMFEQKGGKDGGSVTFAARWH